MTESSKTTGLTLNSLQEFLLEHEDRRRDGHMLATSGGYTGRELVLLLPGDEESWREREGGKGIEREGVRGSEREGGTEEREKEY